MLPLSGRHIRWGATRRWALVVSRKPTGLLANLCLEALALFLVHEQQGM
jgi:hypothetical protein